MPSLLIRRVTLSFSALLTALLLLVAGVGSSLIPSAHAADVATVVLTPVTVSAGPGDSLSVTVSVTTREHKHFLQANWSSRHLLPHFPA